MKRILLALMIVALASSAMAQKRATRMDSLNVRHGVVIKTVDRTSFFDKLNTSNEVQSSAVGDSAIGTEHIKAEEITSSLVKDSTLGLVKFTTAANQAISSGGNIENKVDDISTAVTGTDIKVINPFAYCDTLTTNDATPDISGASVWYTNNTSATAYTDFVNDPAAQYSQVLKILINDAYTSFTHNASSFDCGGVDRDFDSGDVVEFTKFGGKWCLTNCWLN